MAEFPGFAQIFQLHEPFGRRPLRGRFDFPSLGADVTRGRVVVERPISVFWDMGGPDPSDFVWTTSHYPVVVHARVLDVFSQLDATGWKTYQVRVFDKKGAERADYHGLAVVGRCGPRDLPRSPIEIVQLRGGWFPHFRGFFFDEESWDGSDLFMPSNLQTILLTGRVGDALERAGVKNFLLSRLSDELTATSTYEIGPGRAMLPPDFVRRVHEAYTGAAVPRPARWEARRTTT